MEYQNNKPVTKAQRTDRRNQQRAKKNREEEQARQRGARHGAPDELGSFEGQNGELGNTADPRNAQDIGRSAH